MSRESSLTDEEKEILDAYEQGDYESVLTAKIRQSHTDAARQALTETVASDR